MECLGVKKAICINQMRHFPHDMDIKLYVMLGNLLTYTIPSHFYIIIGSEVIMIHWLKSLIRSRLNFINILLGNR